MPTMPKMTLNVPQSVMRQAYAINQLCEESEGRVDINALAPIIGRVPDTIRNSMESNHCPFGFLNGSNKRRDSTLPVLPVWAWFMRNFAGIVDYIEVDEKSTTDHESVS